MTGRTEYLAVTAIVSLVAALVLIFGIGYYESLELLLFQIPAMALPIFVPLALLASTERPRAWGVTLVGAIIAVGWGYMAYVDSQPYQGGGASFAIFFGWAASLLAAVVATLVVIVTTRRAQPSLSPIPIEARAASASDDTTG